MPTAVAGTDVEVAPGADAIAVVLAAPFVDEGIGVVALIEGVATELGAELRPVTPSVGVTPVVGLPHAASESTSARTGRNVFLVFLNRNLPAIGKTPKQRRLLCRQ